ncbi:hypothetical protein EPUL_005815 [Erysiphe pulchra]|uniref:Uncharacterized protein n=1 Tax=Erysiphe pulchra TaxID=225359 RepID=A0A2S4PLQ2_9PEZI|nr:hypothetical protein EPUL_005815 [Erysiphe pulchra]
MICTTIYSGIESTLSNFSNVIEKEEAEVEAFKAYIQLAIAKLAAVDSSPSPPQIPTYTRPTKGDRIGKNKSTGKKVALALPKKLMGVVLNSGVAEETPSLPKIPQIKENTRATVARAGQKKARYFEQYNKTSQTAALSDKRLFIRLPQEYEWRKLSPAGICEVIVKKLHISPSLIGRIKPVHSGFALSPCSSKAREEILKAVNGLFLSGVKLETATNRVSVLVPTVPASVHIEKGLVEVTKAILSDEIERQKLLNAPSCANCGSDNHTVDICMAENKCRNCDGPHRAESRRYLARPTRFGAPPKEQLKTYRQLGEREYQAVQRARIAEEKAGSIDRINIDPICSQVSGDSMRTEISQATPTDDLRAVANRL